MKRTRSIQQYFPGGNTCQGFYSLWDSNIYDLEKLIILKGGPGTGKSTLLSYLAQVMGEKGFNTELLWCSSDAESLDGVVFRDISLGIIDGTAPHLRDPRYPGVVDKIINLGDCWNEKKLLPYKKDIIKATDLNRQLYGKTYEKMALAKKYHDDLEHLYIEGMNWSAVNDMTAKLVHELLDSFPNKKDGIERHRFAGASTPQGPVNYLDELLAEATNRYIMKGRAGTGKSTLTKKIAQAAREKGLNVEYYHCSFDPQSVDNIYMPQLGFCIIDGTAPHEKEAGPQDQVIDMFDFMDPQVYQKNKDKILFTDELYQKTFWDSFEYLKEVKYAHDDMEKYYIQAMDFKCVDKIRESIIEDILTFAEGKE